jgi:hypothetical protein
MRSAVLALPYIIFRRHIPHRWVNALSQRVSDRRMQTKVPQQLTTHEALVANPPSSIKLLPQTLSGVEKLSTFLRGNSVLKVRPELDAIMSSCCLWFWLRLKRPRRLLQWAAELRNLLMRRV